MLATIFAATAALPLLASALTITSPNGGSEWYGNTTNQVSWDWSQDDPHFSIELGNPAIQSGLLAQGPIAVANNIDPQISSLSFELPTLPAGEGYFIAFVAIDNVNNVYSNSTAFRILDNPNSSTIAPTSTKNGQTTGKTSSHSTTTSLSVNRTSTTSTGTTVPTTTSSAITTEQITTLQISTTATTTSTTSGAALRGASVPVGGVLGFLGFVGAVALGA